MVDHHAALFGKIERVLAGAITVAAFEAEFYWFYFEQVPEDALSASDRDFIESVCEKLDFSAPDPDAESRRHGYVSHAEFLAWLRARYAAHEAQDAG